jgi:hypothetical protein
MVGTYKRKSTRQSWDEKAMRNAIEAVKRGEMGWLKASNTFLEPLPLLFYPLLDQARLRGFRPSRRVQFNWGNVNGIAKLYLIFPIVRIFQISRKLVHNDVFVNGRS